MSDILYAANLAIAEGDDVYDGEFNSDILEGIDARSLGFTRCIFTNTTFGTNDIAHISFADCTFINCDLSGFVLRDGSMHRSVLRGCRASGMQADKSVLTDVKFIDCLTSYLTITDCKLTNLHFERCDLTKMMLHTCKLKGLKFTGSNLTSGEFVSTPLKGIDFSTDNISGIRLEPSLLAGARISAVQAVQICALLGVKIV